MALNATAGRLRAPWLLPVVLVLVALVTLGAVVVLSQRVGNERLRPDPPPFSYQPNEATVRLTVKQAGAGKLTLVGDAPKGEAAPPAREIAPGAGTRIEFLRPATAKSVAVGEWMAVIGVPNEVRSFSIHAVVLIPDASSPDADGVVHSPGGFAGHEAAAEAGDRVVLGGPVEAVDGDRFTVRTGAGPVTFTLTDSAPLYRIEAGTVDEVHEGDRVAIHAADGASEAPGALLVQGG